MIDFILHYDGKKVKRCYKANEIGAIVKKKDNVIWIDIKDPSIKDINFLKKKFNFHTLALEDSINFNQRPKLDNYVDNYFLVMHSTLFKGDEVHLNEIDMFLGKNFLITIHPNDAISIKNVKSKIEKRVMILEKGPDFLMYSLIDSIVDTFFPVVNKIDDIVDELEDEIYKNPSPDIMNRLGHLKTNSMILKRSAGQQRDVVNMLIRDSTSAFIKPRTSLYLKDVYDHLYRISETIDTVRDLINTSMDAYLSSVSNKMNEIMKVLTVIATIFIPLTFIAGIYGMNFNVMPELDWQYGYPLVLGIMLAVALGMVMYFKRRQWL